jgi:hypothetical protein
MTEAEVLEILQRHFEGLFPMACSNCGRPYATLREYVLTTVRLGVPISFDAEDANWETERPIGTLALANCPCGSTISLSTRGMPVARQRGLLAWLREESHRRGVRPSGVLDGVRDEIRRRVQADAAP